MSANAATIKLDHIPTLKGASNFVTWRMLIHSSLKDCGIYGHIKGSDNCWDRYPKTPVPPTPTANSNNNIIEKYQKWWQDNNSAKLLMVQKLSALVVSNLQMSDNTTARMVWDQLTVRYACNDINTQFQIKEKLASIKLKDHKDIDNYIGDFCTGCERLVEMGVSYPQGNVIHHMLCGLPTTQTWPNFKQLMVQLYRDLLTLLSNVSVLKPNLLQRRTLLDPNTPTLPTTADPLPSMPIIQKAFAAQTARRGPTIVTIALEKGWYSRTGTKRQGSSSSCGRKEVGCERDGICGSS